jgi:hypothetical protein
MRGINYTVNHVKNVFARLCSDCKSIVTSKLMLFLLAMCVTGVNAQEVTFPTVEIEGVDEDTTGGDMVVIIFKWAARIALWVLMVIAGIIGLRNIYRSWVAQKQNDEAKWGAVVGDVIGNAVMVIFVIAFGTWVLSFLA